MNFYQQKYFKPYQKIVTDYDIPQKQPRFDSRNKNYGHQNSKRSEQSLPQQTNGGFTRSPFKHVYTQKVSEPIWEHLYNQGMKSQKELLQKHKNTKNKIDTECTFRPLIKQSKRYLATGSSSFLERVGIWQQHKLQKMIRQKQEEVNKDLKECTFKPIINNKLTRQKTQYGQLNNERLSKNKSQIKFQNKSRANLSYYSPIKKSRQQIYPSSSPVKKNPPSKVQINFAKHMIRSQLKRMAI